MKLLTILQWIGVFTLGFVSSTFISLTSANFENPLGLFYDSNLTPNDFIDENDIMVYPDRVVIKLDGASIGRYAPTGSMLPVLNEGTNGIRIKPKSSEEINLGDIITYKRGSNLIVHRVVEKGFDEEGVYFVLKGDNNDFDDGKVRFNEIVYKTIALIY